LRPTENTPPPRSVACGAAPIPLSPIASKRRSLRPRLGLSLTEVLIATFVMAIGILSLASLIPVGLHEVAVANRAQHAAIVGRSAWRDIKTREWMRPSVAAGALWYFPNGTSAANLASMPNAFAIDPLFMSLHSTDTVAASFPYNTGNPPSGSPTSSLIRLTLKLSEFDTSPVVSGRYPLAEQIFVSRNDPTFSPINLATGAKTDRPHRVFDSNNLPQIAGEYSWMMTVSPAQGDVGRLSTVSVVVFYKRALQLPALSGTPAEQQKRECIADVRFEGAGIGGGDIRISWTPTGDNQNAPKLKANQWLMIYRQHPVYGVTEAVWYRIVAADDYNPGVSPGVRYLTVQGPDWDTSGGNVTAYAGLFDSVVGVYTKTIQLE